LTVFLDAGPHSLITNPKQVPATIAAAEWVVAIGLAGHRFVVPAIAHFEFRRELLRAGKPASIARLGAFNDAAPDRFLSVSDAALRYAAVLWAESGNSGAPIADPKELNADVIIAAQVLSFGLSTSQFVVATSNVGHLKRFVPSELWTNIHPEWPSPDPKFTSSPVGDSG